MSNLRDPEGYGGVARKGGVGLGEGRVKFPLCTWKLGKAATQPLACLLALQARALYIVLMLLFSCLADGHTAAARITLPQIHQILWLAIKSGVLRDGKRLGKASRPWRHITISLDFEIRSQLLNFYWRTSTLYISLTLNPVSPVVVFI